MSPKCHSSVSTYQVRYPVPASKLVVEKFGAEKVNHEDNEDVREEVDGRREGASDRTSR